MVEPHFVVYFPAVLVMADAEETTSDVIDFTRQKESLAYVSMLLRYQFENYPQKSPSCFKEMQLPKDPQPSTKNVN